MGNWFSIAANYLAASAVVIALGALPVGAIFLIWGADFSAVAAPIVKTIACCVIVVGYVQALEMLGLKT